MCHLVNIVWCYYFGVVLKEDKLLAFEMPQDGGIDLGRVDASQVRFP